MLKIKITWLIKDNLNSLIKTTEFKERGMAGALNSITFYSNYWRVLGCAAAKKSSHTSQHSSLIFSTFP